MPMRFALLGLLIFSLFNYFEPNSPTGPYYVAVDGSDENPGTLDAPFRTIQKCASVAVAGDSCFIHAGTYHETVAPYHSGTETAPILFAPYDRETIYIDGSDPVTGWSVYQGHIYRAQVVINPDLSGRQVFVNGQMMPEARWPNTGLDPLHPTWAVAGPDTSPQSISDDALPALDWRGATVHLWGGDNAFAHQTATVSDFGPNRLTLAGIRPETCPVLCPRPGAFYYVLGGLATLDSATEWAYDPANHWLYFWAPADADPNTLTVTTKQRDLAFDLRGRSYIQIENLHLFGSTLEMDKASQGNLIAGLEARYVSHYTTLPPATPETLQADPQSPIGQLVASHGQDSGLIVAGSGNTVRDSQIAGSAGNGILVLGHDNVVTNTVIHDVGYMGSYATALNVAGYNQTITYNTIYNTGRDGITVDWHVAGPTFLNNRIEYNQI